MSRGYYLWDWNNTKTIVFSNSIEFHCDDYAKTQDAFKRFKDAKAAGIAELEAIILEAQEHLKDLKAVKCKDVVKVWDFRVNRSYMFK